MATGGIFTLITNDGKQDRMLMATQLLNTRLVEIRALREQAGQEDTTPTLVDIERTHILFMNAHFKPFAAIGYEYNKVQPQSGTARFGAPIQYSIPQFGDFFHDMVVNVKVSAGTADGTSYADRWQWADYLGQRLFKKVKFTVNGNPLDEYDSDVYKFHESFYITPNKRTGWKRCLGQEETKSGYLTLPSSAPVQSQSGADRITFTDNSTTDAANDLAGTGWNPDLRECVEYVNGLQTPKRTHPAFELWIPLLFWFNKDPRLAIPSVSIPYGQRFIDLELSTLQECCRTSYDPLLGDISTSTAGTAVTFAASSRPEITEATLYINNVFVNPEIHDIYIKRIGFNLIRVHRIQKNRVTASSGSVLLNLLKWPIETMYVGVRPSENINTTVIPNMAMENWHRFSGVDDSRRVRAAVCGASAVEARTLAAGAVDAAVDVDTGFTISTVQTGTADLNQVTLISGILPASSYNQSGAASNFLIDIANSDQYTVWFNVDGNNTNPGGNEIEVAISATDDADAVAAALVAALAAGGFSAQLVAAAGTGCSLARFKECYPVVNDLDIVAHGISIYNQIPHRFFNCYIPGTYGGHHINTPDDCGAQMITFNLYPGSYQPSGHLNISRAREFYYQYRAASVLPPNPNAAVGSAAIAAIGGAPVRNVGDDWVSNTHSADLLITAIALNFLLISDGSAVLRYST